MNDTERRKLLAQMIVKDMASHSADFVRALALLKESGDVVSDTVTAAEMFKQLDITEIKPDELRPTRDALVSEIEIFLELDAVGQQSYLSALAGS